MKKSSQIAIVAAISIIATTASLFGTKVVISKIKKKIAARKKSVNKSAEKKRNCPICKLFKKNSTQCKADEINNSTPETQEAYSDKSEENNTGVNYKNFTDDILRSMIDTYESKTKFSSGHSERVARISKLIAEKLGVADSDGLYYAALMHDIGKLYLSEELLNKSKLGMTDEEKEKWHNHPKVGAEIVKGIPEISRYADAIKHHHERFDGSGYPDGLKGEEIPLAARIIAVADAYEAMSSERPGRGEYPREYIISELNKCSGNQFDPNVTKAMMSVIADIAE